MKSVIRTSCVIVACVAIVISVTQAQKKKPKATKSPISSLTGVWRGNDGGTYQIRQQGTKVWWYGQSPNNGRDWQNVFSGVITNGQLDGEWADLPPGGMQKAGSLQIRIGAGRLTRIDGTGGFGGSTWVPASGMPVGGCSVGNLGDELTKIVPSQLPTRFGTVTEGKAESTTGLPQIPETVVSWFNDSEPVMEEILRRLAGDAGVSEYLDWERRQPEPSALKRVDLRLKAIHRIVR